MIKKNSSISGEVIGQRRNGHSVDGRSKTVRTMVSYEPNYLVLGYFVLNYRRRCSFIWICFNLRQQIFIHVGT